jgi:hypothetical protein
VVAWAAKAAPERLASGVLQVVREPHMIILGIILLIIGFVVKIAILWTIGIVVLLIGLALALLGMVGHAVGGRRHYF